MTKHPVRPSRRTTLLGGLAVLGAGGLTSIALPAVALPPGAHSVQLRLYYGNWITAPGDQPLTALQSTPAAPETFSMIPLNSSNHLEHGAPFALMAQNGKFVCAEGGGGRELVANRDAVGPWETFTLLRNAGSGDFLEGDMFSMQCSGGQYVIATNGGWSTVLAASAGIGPWEMFTATVLRRRHVRIEFTSVACHNTEDSTGADEFYAAGTAKDRFGGQNTTCLSMPMKINDGQTKDFPYDTAQRVIFEGDVEAASTIALACEFFDQDASNDWDASYTALSAAVSGVLAAAGGPAGVVAGAVLAVLTAQVARLFRLDKDDKLGKYSGEVAIADLPMGTTYRNAAFHKHNGAKGLVVSTWKYDVDIMITVS